MRASSPAASSSVLWPQPLVSCCHYTCDRGLTAKARLDILGVPAVGHRLWFSATWSVLPQKPPLLVPCPSAWPLSWISVWDLQRAGLCHMVCAACTSGPAVSSCCVICCHQQSVSRVQIVVLQVNTQENGDSPPRLVRDDLDQEVSNALQVLGPSLVTADLALPGTYLETTSSCESHSASRGGSIGLLIACTRLPVTASIACVAAVPAPCRGCCRLGGSLYLPKITLAQLQRAVSSRSWRCALHILTPASRPILSSSRPADLQHPMTQPT